MSVSYGIEGNEAAGKTFLMTLTRILLQKTTNFPVLALREPGGTELGELIRPILRNEKFRNMHPVTNTLLYTAPRSELFFNVETPFLENNQYGILLKDRTWLSTLSLQSVDGANIDYIRSVQKPFMGIPAKFIIIDIPVQETVARMYAEYKRENNNREPDWRDKQNVSVLARIRSNYLSFLQANKDKCILLDCFDDPWFKAGLIKHDAIRTFVANKEGGGLGENIILKPLGVYVNEAKYIADTDTAKIFTDEGAKYVKTFDIEKYRQEVEEARRELGLPDREILREKMHEEWRELGLETVSSGIERGK